MWAWQPLLQTSHLCVVSGRMKLLPSFLRARLSAAAAISFSSPVLRCCFRALLHFVRSVARQCQDIVVQQQSRHFPINLAKIPPNQVIDDFDRTLEEIPNVMVYRRFPRSIGSQGKWRGCGSSQACRPRWRFRRIAVSRGNVDASLFHIKIRFFMGHQDQHGRNWGNISQFAM